LPDSHHVGSGSVPGWSTWDLWWTELHWGALLSEYFDFILPFIIPALLRAHQSSPLSSGAVLDAVQRDSVSPHPKHC